MTQACALPGSDAAGHFLLCLSFFPHFWRQGLRMLRLALDFLCSSQSLPPSATIMEVYHHPSLIYHMLFFGNTRVIFWVIHFQESRRQNWVFSISWDRISASSGWPQTLYLRVTDLELLILLLLPFCCWDRRLPSYPVWAFLWCLLGLGLEDKCIFFCIYIHTVVNSQLNTIVMTDWSVDWCFVFVRLRLASNSPLSTCLFLPRVGSQVGRRHHTLAFVTLLEQQTFYQIKKSLMSEIFFAGVDQWSQLEALRDLPERTFAAPLLWRVLQWGWWRSLSGCGTLKLSLTGDHLSL